MATKVRKNRKAEAAEWELYKPAIRRLYLAEQRQLADVIALMEQEFKFSRTYGYSQTQIVRG